MNGLLKQVTNSSAQVDLWPVLRSNAQILIYCAMDRSEASSEETSKLADSENPSYDAKLYKELSTVRTELQPKVASTYLLVKVVLPYC